MKAGLLTRVTHGALKEQIYRRLVFSQGRDFRLKGFHPTVGKEVLGTQPNGLPANISEELNQLLRHFIELMD